MVEGEPQPIIPENAVEMGGTAVGMSAEDLEFLSGNNPGALHREINEAKNFTALESIRQRVLKGDGDGSLQPLQLPDWAQVS